MVEQLSFGRSGSVSGSQRISNEISNQADGEVNRDGDLSMASHTKVVADAYSNDSPNAPDLHMRSILDNTLSGDFGEFQIITDDYNDISIEDFFGGGPESDSGSDLYKSDQPAISIEDFFGVEPSSNQSESYYDNGGADDASSEWSLEKIYRESGGRETVAVGDMLPFPQRQPGRQLGGSEFFRDVLGINPNGDRYQNGVTGLNRELAILRQVEAGNIPDFLRHPKKVVTRDSNGNTAEISVMPDYLAIGTNEDWVRVPMTPILARAIADRYGLELPTEKVADAVYSQADVRLTAEGMVSGSRDQEYMTGNGFYLTHNQKIERQLGGTPDGALVAGHKKDIIFSRFAASRPDRLDFYGFFRSNGTPIQNAGGGPHDNLYVDYSHGARFVGETVLVNGQSMRYSDVLSNPRLAGLLSDEGTVDVNSIYRQPKDSSYRALY